MCVHLARPRLTNISQISNVSPSFPGPPGLRSVTILWSFVTNVEISNIYYETINER